jgi:hypothetical protein
MLWIITEADRSVTTLLLPEEVLGWLSDFRPRASRNLLNMNENDITDFRNEDEPDDGATS